MGSNLRWRQPATFARRYELSGGGAAVAELEFLKKAGSLARGRSNNQEWTFERQGMAFSKPVIRNAEGVQLGEYRPNTFGNRGTLALEGRTYDLVATTTWNTDWQWLDAQGDALAGFRFKSGIPNAAEVFLADPDMPELGLLLTFGFYVLILPHEDAAAMPGSITASRDE